LESNCPEVQELQKEELICPILLIVSDLKQTRTPFHGNSGNPEKNEQKQRFDSIIDIYMRNSAERNAEQTANKADLKGGGYSLLTYP